MLDRKHFVITFDCIEPLEITCTIDELKNEVEEYVEDFIDDIDEIENAIKLCDIYTLDNSIRKDW